MDPYMDPTNSIGIEIKCQVGVFVGGVKLDEQVEIRIPLEDKIVVSRGICERESHEEQITVLGFVLELDIEIQTFIKTTFGEKQRVQE
ncbi:hypothetical protein CDAR_8171 [Caerostris darwini]|uniref:Uncharacterized protein n=1 Tax=Caerostris darwini TaxID=1538125 RepID=A0AAV4SU56_9ARAC|nr:hypothetical protein CDAR_8171 [Caerostris darwini]